MKRMLLCLLACVGVVGGGEKIANVDGKKITRPIPFHLCELVAVRDVRAVNCKAGDEKKPSCAITGVLISRLPSSEYVVTLTFRLVRVPCTDHAEVQDGGEVKMVVSRPEPGEEVKFSKLCDEWFTGGPDPQGEKWSACYSVTVQVARYMPNQAATK